MMKINRIIIFTLIFILFNLNVSAVSCDCHPSGNQNRVCVFTEPLPGSIALNGDTFEFDILVRSYYRTEYDENIVDIETSLISCKDSNNNDCPSNYFNVDIDPDYISYIDTLDNSGACSNTPTACASCTTGRVGEPMATSIQINNAPDGVYVLKFETTWGPPPLELCEEENIEPCPPWNREIEITIEFSSGCESDSECDDGDDCTQDTCSNDECVYTNLNDNPCDTSNYDCMTCNNGVCNQDSDSECGTDESCNSGMCIADCTDTCSSEGY